MKCLIICSLILAATAEPPRFRARFRSQRLELAPTTTDSSIESTTDSGPYPPSGWKPSGAAFTLPIDTTPTPTDTYGPPEVSGYQPSGWKPDGQPFTLPIDTTPTPIDVYGPPETNGPYPPSGWKPDGQSFTLPQEQTSTTYGIPDHSYQPTDANKQVETVVEPVEVQKSVGTYYLLLPNGQLQRVEYVTESDLQNMKYLARLQLSGRGPLFVFGP
ncbi:mucin-2-like [Bicyclus anynana]|uniref:Mucin-2-like n=1 Tax=Bicyclus anynana TaxID=110368 RepID=A0A6J1MYN9_BICAN|nr:mucin-2-like [Bicyclus anynana]